MPWTDDGSPGGCQWMPVTLRTVSLTMTRRLVAGLVLELVDTDLGTPVSSTTSAVTEILASASASVVIWAPSTTITHRQVALPGRAVDLLDLHNVALRDLCTAYSPV